MTNREKVENKTRELRERRQRWEPFFLPRLTQFSHHHLLWPFGRPFAKNIVRNDSIYIQLTKNIYTLTLRRHRQPDWKLKSNTPSYSAIYSIYFVFIFTIFQSETKKLPFIHWPREKNCNTLYFIAGKMQKRNTI